MNMALVIDKCGGGEDVDVVFGGGGEHGAVYS